MKIYTEKELTKVYYSIREVAEMFQVNASLIRFWHKEFDKHIKPKLNAKGNRMFTPKDVVIISKIYNLVKIQGFTLEGAKKTLKSKTLDLSEQMISTETSTAKEQFKKELIDKLESLKEKLQTSIRL